MHGSILPPRFLVRWLPALSVSRMLLPNGSYYSPLVFALRYRVHVP